VPHTIGGIPLHPLVVHAAIVLIPLAAIGVMLIAFVPRWRERYGGLVALFALGALVGTLLAKFTGENFQKDLGITSEKVTTHADLGQKMLYFVIPLFLVAIALWWVGRREKEHQPYGVGLTISLGVVSVIVALAAGVWVVRVGHSGANAVWGGTVATTNSGAGG